MNVSDATKRLTNVQIEIKSVLESTYKKYLYIGNPKMKEYTSKLFPLSNGNLEYWQYIRSPVVEILTGVAGDYNTPSVLTLHSDVLVGSRVALDYCVAKAEAFNSTHKVWKCLPVAANIDSQHKQATDHYSYQITKDGEYTVLYYPLEVVAEEIQLPCNFYCQYRNEIIYGSIIATAVLIVILYIFWRCLRYVFKYRKGKTEKTKYERQINEI